MLDVQEERQSHARHERVGGWKHCAGLVLTQDVSLHSGYASESNKPSHACDESESNASNVIREMTLGLVALVVDPSRFTHLAAAGGDRDANAKSWMHGVSRCAKQRVSAISLGTVLFSNLFWQWMEPTEVPLEAG